MNTAPALKRLWESRRAIILKGRNTIIAIGWIIGVILFMALLEELSPSPHAPEQKAKAKEEAAWRNATCKQMKRCESYGVVRLGCAVAADFNNCVKIRMGEDYRFVSPYCTDDGRLQGATDTPSAFQCFVSTLSDLINRHDPEWPFPRKHR